MTYEGVLEAQQGCAAKGGASRSGSTMMPRTLEQDASGSHCLCFLIFTSCVLSSSFFPPSSPGFNVVTTSLRALYRRRANARIMQVPFHLYVSFESLSPS